MSWEMVCLPEDDPVTLPVIDVIGVGPKSQSSICLIPSKNIYSIFTEIGADFNYEQDTFELIMQNRNGNAVLLSEHKDKTLEELGIVCNATEHYRIVIGTLEKKDMSLRVNETNEDDLLLGASASPTTGEIPSTTCDLRPTYISEEEYPLYSPYNQLKAIETTNYIGLVNQAMTCYLNSLLQALYMTPEFRNALYNWEFDGQNETRSIPFQLQKLFLNLQTSKRSAVETTDLTTSFGWQGSEAWHQHDIQELCRVMFDALEHKFKDTQQANLINDLYEGKMLDYVKCLECGTEKSREDTFLDIPLPVRPFGSNVAYGSIEEALGAFVQPETLEGNNQYYCEKCNKKCDAHKGLKFTKFPYLLTLHLKRFDFDYNTMHRIKLNDKVVFPEKLNLNSFTSNNRCSNTDTIDERDMVKCDDCSTTDSGSALDDESCQGTDVSSTINGQDDNCEDSDEGIDVSSGNNHQHHENEVKGPYLYELFSIMIHSGSASGGHYYAYIKDFDKNQWFCFNDQNVNRITEDDIKKTYGGGPQRGYYSGAYSSSTNAYMLMYRQIDKERNRTAMTCDEFPVHIQMLLQQIRRKEEEDRLNKEKENNMIKLNVYCYHPLSNSLQDIRMSMLIDSTLAEAASYARQRFKLDRLIDIDDCRIVSYNRTQECIDSSFGSNNLKFCDTVWCGVNLNHSDWMLEIKKPGTEFQKYQKGGINMKVYPVNLETEEVDEPKIVRVNVGDKVIDLKNNLSTLLKMDVNTMKVVIKTSCSEPKYLDSDDTIVKFEPNCLTYKLYVSNAIDEDIDALFYHSKLYKIIEKFRYVISFSITLPDTDLNSLEVLSIPPLELNQNSDSERNTNSPSLRISPQPGGICGDGFGDQSNSEDSSLSDSDRTLVGDAPGEYQGLVLSGTNSPADLHMTSPTDPAEDTYNYDVLGNPGEEMNWETEEKCENYYFKVTSVTDFGTNTENTRCCKVFVDMRVTLEKFKKYLEPTLKVPAEYFKIFRQFSDSYEEWSLLTDTLRSAKDGERLIVKLGRVLSWNEYNCKVYLLTPECTETTDCLFEHIIARGQYVSQVKKAILKQMQKQNLQQINSDMCRLREKCWKKPQKVFLDNQKFFDDITISSNFELYIQELVDVEKVTSTDQLILFVRHWCPSTLTLQPFQEVVLDELTVDELKKKISELSDIPQEKIEIAHCRTAFPCDMHVLDIHTELEWNPNAIRLDEWLLQIDDGCTFFYRDKREKLKELTKDERKEFNHKENARLGRFSTKTYSPGRERALKIYLDASPSKPDENCID